MKSAASEALNKGLLDALDYRRKELEAQVEDVYRPLHGDEWKHEAMEELVDYRSAYEGTKQLFRLH